MWKWEDGDCLYDYNINENYTKAQTIQKTEKLPRKSGNTGGLGFDMRCTIIEDNTKDMQERGTAFLCNKQSNEYFTKAQTIQKSEKLQRRKGDTEESLDLCDELLIIIPLYK